MNETLIPDREVRRRLGVSTTTIWRWQQDESVGFPPAIYIRGRRFRDSEQLEAWRKKMVENPEAGRRKPNGNAVSRTDAANAANRKRRRKSRKAA